MIFPPVPSCMNIMALNSQKHLVVDTLQSLGIAHISDADYSHPGLNPDTSLQGIEDISSALVRLRHILRITHSSQEITIRRLPRLSSVLSQGHAYLSSHESSVLGSHQNVERLIQQKKHIVSQLNILNSLPKSFALKPKKCVRIFVSGQNFNIPSTCGHSQMFKHKGKYFAYVYCNKSQSKKLDKHLSGVSVKEMDVSFVKSSASTTNVKLKTSLLSIEQDLMDTQSDLIDSAGDTYHLNYLVHILENYYAQFSISNKFKSSENFFVLKAFVDSDQIDIIKKALPDAWVTLAPRDDSTPTKLSNNKIARHFQAITELFSTPKAGMVDPSSIIAWFFPIFFGFMLSDIGYGLMLLIGTLAFYHKLNGNLRSVRVILVLSSLSTILFGILFGSFFGGLITIPALYGDPFSKAKSILIISLAIGLIHLNIAALLNILQHIRKSSSFVTTITDIGPFLLLEISAIVAFFSQWLVFGALIAIIILLLIKKGGFLAIMDISGYVGTWFSYARLLALCLATAGVALAVNTMAQKALLLGKVGIVLWVLIIVLGHIFNFVVNLIGTAINSARLQYVEFFSLFFEGGGITFKPFAVLYKNQGGVN